MTQRRDKTAKRKRTEELMRKSEERYRDLVENATDLIQSVTPEGSFIYVNRAWRETLGYSEDEIPGLSLMDIVHPDSKAHCAETLQRVMARENIERVEAMFVAKDGRTITVEGNVNCRFKDGKPFATRGIFRDVTERKQVEETLRESEARYKALFAGAPEGMLVADLQTQQFRHANPAICRMFGYTEEEFLRLGVTDIHPKESLSYVLTEFEAQARGEKLLSADLPCQRKDGSLFYANVNAVMVALDGLRCIVGFFTDVTERKKAEEALRSHAAELEDLNRQLVRAHDELNASRSQLVEKSALLQSVVEAQVVPLSEKLQGTAGMVFSRLAGVVPAGAFALAIVSEDQPLVLIFAPVGLSRRVTDEIRHRMSKAAEIVLGRKLSRTIPFWFEPITQGSTKVGPIRSHAILPLASPDLETQVLGGMFSGKADAFEDDHVALFSAAGVSLASLYLGRIAHAKEEELRWRQSEFVATVSHELRTPIHSIWGFVKLLLAGKVQDEETRREFLGIVDGECAHLTALVGDFLDVSKIEAGRMETRRELFSLDELVNKTVAAFKTVADDRALTIDTDLPEDLPPVEGDTERLGQVLTNLLGNASKFSEDGGTIMVRVRVEGPELVVSVQDQGIGIATEALPYLFERFYQVDDSRTRWQGGAGLGLYISRQIVEAHGGRIWVDSIVGEGSTFSFAIPVAASDNEDIRTDEAA
jgi:PAS domain S-box-containing protein